MKRTTVITAAALCLLAILITAKTSEAQSRGAVYGDVIAEQGESEVVIENRLSVPVRVFIDGLIAGTVRARGEKLIVVSDGNHNISVTSTVRGGSTSREVRFNAQSQRFLFRATAPNPTSVSLNREGIYDLAALRQVPRHGYGVDGTRQRKGKGHGVSGHDGKAETAAAPAPEATPAAPAAEPVPAPASDAGLPLAETATDKDKEANLGPAGLVPAGYAIAEGTEIIRGDLNKDGQEDVAIIVKGTDPAKIMGPEEGSLDNNRRGIIIAFKKGDGYEVALENLECFASPADYSGRNMIPEFTLRITNGNLFIRYCYGRYGNASYNFSYRNSDFQLIGYDYDSWRTGGGMKYAGVTDYIISINFLTKKMLRKRNRAGAENDGRDAFTETWEDFTLTKPILLREISDFDEFNVTGELNK